MKTRNQIKQEERRNIQEFNSEFFDASSKAWLANKIKYGQDMYRYKDDAFLRRSKRLLEQQLEKKLKETSPFN